MDYPDDATLIERGRYATLSKERYAQIERVQNLSKQIMHYANPLLADCQERPPVDGVPLKMLEDCVRNARTARDKLIEICIEQNKLKGAAWPE
jgi:hypothetical protein